MITGYKYIEKGNDIYFITLLCNNEKAVIDGYYTTDCIVEKIENANTGELVEEISGRAYYKSTYRQGEHITEHKVYYCHSIQELFDCFHVEKVNGMISRPTISGMFNYFRLNHEKYIENKEKLRKILIEYAKKRGWIN